MKIKIVPGTDITVKTWGAHNAKSTKFSAQYVGGEKDGKVDNKAEAAGDLIEFLKKAQADGTELEATATTNDHGFSKYVFAAAPKAFGGGFGAGGGFKKFDGQKVDRDEFVAITNQLLIDFVKGLATAGKVTSASSDALVVAMIAEARSLCAQFWMEYEKGVVVLKKGA